jgi:hypothetical protein
MRFAGNLIATVNLKAFPAIDRGPDRCTVFSLQAPGVTARRDTF